MADRIILVRVGAVTDYQEFWFALFQPINRLLQGLPIAAPVGTARQRQVQDIPFALVFMAPEERIVPRRIGMNRSEEDVLPTSEYVLCSIAVMIVDIEDRDPLRARP